MRYRKVVIQRKLVCKIGVADDNDGHCRGGNGVRAELPAGLGTVDKDGRQYVQRCEAVKRKGVDIPVIRKDIEAVAAEREEEQAERRGAPEERGF